MVTARSCSYVFLTLILSTAVRADVLYFNEKGQESFSVDASAHEGAIRELHSDYLLWQPYTKGWKWEGDYLKVPFDHIKRILHEIDTLADLTDYQKRYQDHLKTGTGAGVATRFARATVELNVRLELDGAEADAGTAKQSKAQLLKWSLAWPDQDKSAAARYLSGCINGEIVSRIYRSNEYYADWDSRKFVTADIRLQQLWIMDNLLPALEGAIEEKERRVKQDANVDAFSGGPQGLDFGSISNQLLLAASRAQRKSGAAESLAREMKVKKRARQILSQWAQKRESVKTFLVNMTTATASSKKDLQQRDVASSILASVSDEASLEVVRRCIPHLVQLLRGRPASDETVQKHLTTLAIFNAKNSQAKREIDQRIASFKEGTKHYREVASILEAQLGHQR